MSADARRIDLALAANRSALSLALNLLPPRLDTQTARVQLLAIGLQESGLKDRVQIVAGGGKGPARGLLQFELGGGVRGVLTHPASAKMAAEVCVTRRVPAMTASVVWGELSRDDVLAFALGRLLLLTDPHPLPALGDIDEAWNCYVRTWRPGKPHRDRWTDNYAAALASVKAT